MDDLQYVGRHGPSAPVPPEQVRLAIEDIRELPRRLAEAVGGLDDSQLDTPYRPQGWTVRQVVVDSHLNAYVLLRLAVTEDRPPIQGYRQEPWAELPDARTLPVEPSLEILRGLHERWTALLDRLDAEHLGHPLQHSEIGTLTVGQLTCLYGWHSCHHVAHITSLRERKGWK